MNQGPYGPVSNPLHLPLQIVIPGGAFHDGISVFQRDLLHTGLHHGPPFRISDYPKVLSLFLYLMKKKINGAVKQIAHIRKIQLIFPSFLKLQPMA